MYTVVTASSDYKIRLNDDTEAQVWWKLKVEKSLVITLTLNQTKCTFIPHIQVHSTKKKNFNRFSFAKMNTWGSNYFEIISNTQTKLQILAPTII